MAFNAFGEVHRRIIKAPINPLDRCTVVSIYPRPIREVKPTLQPGIFNLASGTYEKPSILVVGTANWYREIDDSQPMLEIPSMSIQVADSIVKDYCNGLLACDMGNNMPGLFYVMGFKAIPGDPKQSVSESLTLEWIKKDHKNLLDEAKRKQDSWFRALVKLADVQWARSQGNPLSVDDTMRMAADELGFKDKAWLKDLTTIDLVKCIACGQLRNPLFPICPACKAINDPEAAKNIKFAN